MKQVEFPKRATKLIHLEKSSLWKRFYYRFFGKTSMPDTTTNKVKVNIHNSQK